MFFFKKVIGYLSYPLSLGAEALIIGLILLWFTRRQKAGRAVVSLGSVLLLIFSSDAFSNLLLRPLEGRHPPIILGSETHTGSGVVRVDFIAVLGSGFSPDLHIPLTSQLGRDSLARLVEGVRIYRELSGSKIIMSGGSLFERVPQAEVMAKIAVALGVRKDDIILESQSRDTADEARLIQPIVGKKEFFLVTSASHMPRSMALFNKLGMNPIAAPADFQYRQKFSLFPTIDALENTTRALHEYMGLAWEKLSGQI